MKKHKTLYLTLLGITLLIFSLIYFDLFSQLEHFTNWLVYFVLNLPKNNHLASALNFFLYDSTKILFLLLIIIFFMGIINSYFPIERVKNYLSRKKLYGLEYLMASLFGTVTPFCSCSSVPLFIGFVSGGIPLGVTFAFLVTSPLVNEVAIGLFVGLFGIKTTAIYVISGVILGTLSGIILQSFRLERYLSPWVKDLNNINYSIIDIAEKEWESNPLADLAYKHFKDSIFPLTFCDKQIVRIGRFPEQADIFAILKNPVPITEKDILAAVERMNTEKINNE